MLLGQCCSDLTHVPIEALRDLCSMRAVSLSPLAWAQDLGDEPSLDWLLAARLEQLGSKEQRKPR